MSWELPIVLPVSNEAGTVSKYLFIFSPAPADIADNKIYYFLGDFDVDTGKFTPDERFEGIPQLLDYGANVLTGPSAFIDPVSGDVILFSIMQDQRGTGEQGASGWAHTAGLAKSCGFPMMAPVEALTGLEEDILINASNLTLEQANEKLAQVSGDMLHIKLTVDISKASEFGIHLKQGGKWDCTTYRYETAEELIYGTTENRGEG